MGGEKGNDRKRLRKRGQQRPKKREAKTWEGNEVRSDIHEHFSFCLNRFLSGRELRDRRSGSTDATGMMFLGLQSLTDIYPAVRS